MSPAVAPRLYATTEFFRRTGMKKRIVMSIVVALGVTMALPSGAVAQRRGLGPQIGVQKPGFGVPRRGFPRRGFNVPRRGFFVPGRGFVVPGRGFVVPGRGFFVPG